MFGGDIYEKRTSFQGDPEKALEAARNALMGIGFRIQKATDRELVVTGPGMSSSRGPALNGASLATITVRGSSIQVQARLGGLARLRFFLFLFPVAMALFFLLFFGFQSGFSWNYALPLAPWLILSPLMTYIIKRRTTKAWDVLVENMAVVGGE